MTDLATMLTDRSTRIAVVGATDSPGKYGGIVYQNLKKKGFDVVAVNPHRDTVDGDPTYPTVSDVPGTVDMVNFVVPPDVGRTILEDLDDSVHVWLQPGAESDDLVDDIEAGGFDATIDRCIMVATSVPPR